ncbi:hypothetical protein [Flavobacterium sp. GCM10023249]|uniref:hypothetical protein n=1 Tax=unclassified Flavobacterium TaxID=196869 RepID=UPI0036111BBE
MTKFFFFTLFISCTTLFSQVGVGTVAPNAALDVTSTDDGILIPRIALVNTTTATVVTPTTSEIVYNTATINDVTPGFYYWNGTVWVRILTGANDDWRTTGNTGTTAGTNYIGTTDAVDFRIKTQATDRWNISNANNGQLQSYSLGTAALPTFSWQSDTNTGIFSSGADQLDFSTNGAARFRIPAANQVHALSLGTAALPFYSFSADTNTGIFSPGADQVDFSTNGAARFRIPAADQVHALSLGTAALPFYSFSGDPDIGLWSPTANNLAFSTNATERWRLDANGNVGVGQSLPKGVLDIDATDRGIVFPRVALTASNVQAPIINPQTGTIPAGTVVYNTATAGVSPNNVSPGLYFWNGTRWYAFAGSSGGLDWSLTGNSGTSVGTNFLGTTDAQDLAIRTNNIERARILQSNGHFLINRTANDVTSGTDNIFEVLASTDGDDAINGYATGTGIGVFGTTTGTGVGVRGTANNATGTAISGSNTDVAGPGIIGSGGNAAGSYYTTSGINGNGLTTGAVGLATTVADGVGVRGNGNNVSTNTTSGIGAGVAGSGTQIGVFGHASNTTGSKHGGVFTSEHGAGGTTDNPYAYLAGSDGTLVYGGYFDANQDNVAAGGMDYAYVGVVSGGTTYKILGTGTVSTMVEDSNNEKRIMFAPEAPEILFQDYGIGQLNNGEANIILDKILTKNIHVDENNPLKVFIQLEGDCEGVYVTNKSANGFTVKELKNGKSNVSFSWQIVASRADMMESVTSKKIHSKHVGVRFPVGPGPLKHRNEHKETAVKVKERKE